MKLTARSEYALLALVYLGRQKPGELASAEKIAHAQDSTPLDSSEAPRGTLGQVLGATP